MLEATALIFAAIVPVLYEAGVRAPFRGDLRAAVIWFASWVLFAVGLNLPEELMKHPHLIATGMAIPALQLTFFHLLKLAVYRSWHAAPRQRFYVPDTDSTSRDRVFDATYMTIATLAAIAALLSHNRW